MSNTQTAIAIRDDMSLGQLGEMLARSGYFTDARDAAQCVVKVLAGKELGFGPVASMTGVYIVKGKVSLSANLMAAAVRRSGRYTFKVNTLTPTACEIEFFEIIAGKRESLGVSAFTLADAQKAGTQNLDKFPRNMLYARAMSNGVKWFTPDVTGGPVYTPEEMGERVNEDGEIIDAQPIKPAPYVAPAPAPIPATNGHKPDTWAAKVAALDASDTHREALKTTYGDLFAIVTAASEGVAPYPAPPANRGEALARCKDMAPIADKAQTEAAQ
jgi:hypothetical protein